MTTTTSAATSRTYPTLRAAWIPLAALCLAFFVEMVDNTRGAVRFSSGPSLPRGPVMGTAPTWDQDVASSLRVLSDGEVHRARQMVEAAADLLGVTAEQRQILIPSGQEQWVNRANWAPSYLAHAGVAERPTPGRFE